MTLRLDWCSHQAALYACTNWHYSRCMPAGKVVKIGVWEHDRFIGCVLFSRGATPNIGRPFGLTQVDVCELTRVALTKHQAPVSRILAIALKMLQHKNPDLLLAVSYADADQNHYGGIYQATNWIYLGLTNANARGAFIVKGKKIHPRSIGAAGGVQSLAWVRQYMDPNATEFITTGKHKYVYPFDEALRERLRLQAHPYPKRVGSADSGTGGVQPSGGGASPTSTLHLP